MAGQKNMVTRVNQPEILGILWMVLTGLLFLGVTVLVKILGPRVPAPEAAFLRYLLGLVSVSYTHLTLPTKRIV